jgi:hypothetical protein
MNSSSIRSVYFYFVPIYLGLTFVSAIDMFKNAVNCQMWQAHQIVLQSLKLSIRMERNIFVSIRILMFTTKRMLYVLCMHVVRRTFCARMWYVAGSVHLRDMSHVLCTYVNVTRSVHVINMLNIPY